MKKTLITLSATLLLLACNETAEKSPIVNNKKPGKIQKHTHSLGISDGCEQVDFSTIPANNLNLFLDLDTVFEGYTSECLLIHIPDSLGIVNGDDKMKILLQSGNYSSINSIEKSKVFKDGENCLYNYIVLNLKMNTNQPTNYSMEYEMSVPITAAEWSSTDMILLQVDGENKKIVGTKTGGEPREKPPINN